MKPNIKSARAMPRLSSESPNRNMVSGRLFFCVPRHTIRHSPTPQSLGHMGFSISRRNDTGPSTPLVAQDARSRTAHTAAPDSVQEMAQTPRGGAA
jgi:hypothetical protein